MGWFKSDDSDAAQSAEEKADERWERNQDIWSAGPRQALERARVLARHEELSSDALGQLCAWDEHVLSEIAGSRDEFLPGTPKELSVIRAAAHDAYRAAIKRVLAGAEPTHSRNVPPSIQFYVDWLRDAADGDYATIDVGDFYVQWKLLDGLVRLEVSGGVAIGGKADLNPRHERLLSRMGWNDPREGEFPNYWQEVDEPYTDRGRFDEAAATRIAEKLADALELLGTSRRGL